MKQYENENGFLIFHILEAKNLKSPKRNQTKITTTQSVRFCLLLTLKTGEWRPWCRYPVVVIFNLQKIPHNGLLSNSRLWTYFASWVIDEINVVIMKLMRIMKMLTINWMLNNYQNHVLQGQSKVRLVSIDKKTNFRLPL